MSSYLIILILNLISLLPILNLLSLINLINKFFFIIINSIAFVFLISKLTIFRTSYSIIILLIFCRIFITSFILPSIMNFRLFIKDRQVIWGIFSFTFLNTPLIYIKKRIGDTGEPYGISIFIIISGFIYPSIISSTFLFIIKD